ncbi:CPBP family intramembrane glutamic endopeptidase [Pumilibacter intestinalis]|uniref:CPBP family intramembrane glutamic endopeptidase n=1 Tax=Pumilibacter intestinalis TaxID=2941511 RepID=UPI00203D1795|nr:CPBP family intramembrane glutamic endopeptidase [Pumilibacter intestinalis]
MSDNELGNKQTGFVGSDKFGLMREPIYGIIVVTLFALGIVLLPGEDLGSLFLGGGGTNARNLGNAVFRFVGFALLTLLAVNMGVRIFSFKTGAKGFLLALPFALVAANNAPFAGLATGEISVNASGLGWFLFALNCVSVGLFEELVFRGIIFPLVLAKTKNDRKGVFLAVVISSAVFGAIHLVNLFSSNPLAVLCQVGYSFLVGAMCAMVMLLCRNVFACALLHAGYNFAGLAADTLGTGTVWNAFSIALTVCVSLAAAGYWAYLMLRQVKAEDIKPKLIRL